MPDTFRVTIGQRTHTVALMDQEAGQETGKETITNGQARLRAVVDGVERLLDVRRVGPGAWSVLADGEVRLVEVDGTVPKLSVEVSHADGEPRQAAVEVARAGSDGAVSVDRAVTGPTIVRAPIPGKLVKVLVKAGDHVKAGQTLVVLEAMKMENELRAPREGAVTAVHVREGSAVETGQELLSLDAKA